MQAKLTLEDWRVIDITLTPEQEKAIEVKKVGRWKPNVWKPYFFPKVSHIAEADEYQWENDDADNNFYKHWMVFKTSEEVQFYLNKQAFITKVNDRIDELNDWWVADWMDDRQNKHYIYSFKSRLRSHFTDSTRMDRIINYMKSAEIAHKIISEFKDDLMKYIFN